jgi:hypothetical protein
MSVSHNLPGHSNERTSDAEGQMTTELGSCLVASGNTYNPSLIVLRQKGYTVRLDKGDNSSLWCASKGDQSFLAYSGPELLGVVALWENLGKNWNQQIPDVYSELIDEMKE